MSYVYVKDTDGCLLRCESEDAPQGMEIFMPGKGWQPHTWKDRFKDWSLGSPLNEEQASEMQAEPVAAPAASE